MLRVEGDHEVTGHDLGLGTSFEVRTTRTDAGLRLEQPETTNDALYVLRRR